MTATVAMICGPTTAAVFELLRRETTDGALSALLREQFKKPLLGDLVCGLALMLRHIVLGLS